MNKLIISILILLIGAISIGCDGFRYVSYTRHPGSNVPFKIIPVYIDSGFGSADKTAIDDAVNQWNYVLNGYMEMRVVTHQFNDEEAVIKEADRSHGIIVKKVFSDNEMIPSIGMAEPLLESFDGNGSNGMVLAWVNKLGGNRMYFVRDRLGDRDVLPVALHEFGHALGAEHEAVKPENRLLLMYPYYNKKNGYSCIDMSAMNKVANWQYLDPKGLNYCDRSDVSR